MDLTLEVVTQLSIDAYTRAHEKFTSVIVGDLPSVQSDQISDNDPCANSLPDVIDDVHICGREVPIDGTLNIVGQATWLFAREINGKWTAVTGFMNFDCADTQFLSDKSLLDTLILHESAYFAISCQVRVEFILCQISHNCFHCISIVSGSCNGYWFDVEFRLQQS